MDPLGFNQLNTQIPAAEAAIEKATDHAALDANGLIDRLAAQFNDSLTMGLSVIAKIENKAALDVQAILASLDGWTFTIAPITIRLNKPK